MNTTAQHTPVYESADGKVMKVETATATEYHAYYPQGQWLGRARHYFGAVAILNAQ